MRTCRANYGIAQQIANQLRRVPGTADVHVQQMLGLPTLHLNIDRDLVTQIGMSPLDVAQSVLVSLSGSFQTAPSFWLNPKNGVTYQMVVQAPQYRMTSLQDLMNLPINDRSVANSQVLGNLVRLSPTSTARGRIRTTVSSRSSTSTRARKDAIWEPWPGTPRKFCSRAWTICREARE